MGKFNIQEVNQAGGMFAMVILFSYVCIMMFIILNIFIVILSDYMAIVNSWEPPKDHEVIDQMVDMFSSLVTKKKTEETEHGWFCLFSLCYNICRFM